ncbi:MAG: peptidyl-prolyl cis-trans isomerase D [Crocinitomicaceae bacterium]|jgi:peptidyl-prolyl cis-trans isomerase D
MRFFCFIKPKNSNKGCSIMLQAMRDGSKGLVAKIIVGLIILTFALFGIDGIVALGGGQPAPAEVNGEEISEAKVSQMVQLQKRRLQSQFGESFTLGDSQLRSIALNGLIDEVVLKQTIINSGAYFSDAEIDKIILTSPEFQVGGQFDRNQFDLVLRSAGFTRSSYRELMRTNLLIQQGQTAWQATAFSTQVEEVQVAKLDAQARDFSTVKFSLEDAKKSVSVSDEEANTYFQENSSQYMSDETVVVDYLELNRSDLSASIQVDEDQVESRYLDMIAEAASKKEYRAAHILILDSSKESRKKLSELALKANAGEDFSELAKEFSEDDSSKYAGGDLGFSSLSVYEPEFSSALSGLEIGDISTIIETRDGLHLIKLLEQRQPEIGLLSDLAESIEISLKEELSQSSYVEALEILKDDAFSSNSIAEAAQSLDLTVKTSAQFSMAGGKGIASNRTIVEAAFSDVVISEGANSEVIEIADGIAVVVHLNTFNESKIKQFSDVKAEIVSLLENRMAIEQLAANADTALSEARLGNYSGSWESVNDKRRASTGIADEVLASVFALPESEAKTFSLVSISNGDQILIRLDKVARPNVSSTTKDETQKVSRTKAFNEYRAYQQFANEQSDIERN